MKIIRFYCLLALAVLMLAACGNSGRQQTDAVGVNDEETIAEAEEVMEETPSVENMIIGELGLFELHGPVKSCTWKGVYYTSRLEFDANGMWTKLDKKKPWANQPNVKRDEQGRIVKMDNGDESTEYTYDELGRVTRRVINSCFPRWVTQLPCRHSGTTSRHNSDCSSSMPR